MELEQYKKQAQKLFDWIYGDGEGNRVFFVNGYLGHKVSTNNGMLIITESENGNSNYAGGSTGIPADDIDEMVFDKDEYKFMVTTKHDGTHRGQGYDIEVYTLERVEMGE